MLQYHAEGTEAMRANIGEVPEGVLLQFAPKGSYQLKHTMDFYKWECTPATCLEDVRMYMHDWYAPNLDPTVDQFFEDSGHALNNIPANTTSLCQVPDTRAHGPLSKIYKKHEVADAYFQLKEGDVIPCTSKNTVLHRATKSYDALDHDRISFGFVEAGIANDLHGNEDQHIDRDMLPFWEHNNMVSRREDIRKLIKAGIDKGDYKKGDHKDFVKTVRSPGFLIPFPGFNLSGCGVALLVALYYRVPVYKEHLHQYRQYTERL